MGPDISKILERFPAGKRDALIPLLQAIQAETGYLSGELLEQVSKHLVIPLNKVYGVATFYDQFRFRPNGKFHFKICHGTSCNIFGNTTLLQEMEKELHVRAGGTTRDGKFSLEVVTCLGSCEQGPIVLVNNRPHRKMTPESLAKIIESIKENDEPNGIR
jgi:NADH-quinone oxidoreductase subunit E